MLFDNVRELLSVYKKQIRIVLVVSLLIGLISLLLSYKIVIFNTSDSKDMTISGYSLKDIDSIVAKPVELSVGLNFVAKNVNYFEISQNQQGQIIAEKPLPFYAIFQTFDIALKPQKQLTKTYTGPYSCLIESQTDIYSYSCSNPTYAYNYVTSKTPWRNEPTVDIAQQRSLVPYKDGTLGIRAINDLRYDEPLVYTNVASGKKVTYELPSQLTPIEINTSSIHPSQTNSDILLLASSQAKHFYVLNIASNKILKKVAYPKNYTKDNGVSCQVVGNQATCFIGKLLQSIDKEVDYDRDSLGSTIYKFDLTVSDKLNTQAVDSDLHIQSIYTSSSGNLYGLTDQNLLVKIDQSGDSVVIARNVQSVTTADKLYFSRDNSLYSLDEKNQVSNLAFETSGNVSSVQSLNNQTYMTMLAVDSQGQTLPNTYTFKLTSKDVTDKPWRILELAKNKYVRSVDFNDGKIFILPWPAGSSQQRAQVTKSIEADIKKLSLDTSKYQIVYYFR